MNITSTKEEYAIGVIMQKTKKQQQYTKRHLPARLQCRELMTILRIVAYLEIPGLKLALLELMCNQSFILNARQAMVGKVEASYL